VVISPSRGKELKAEVELLNEVDIAGETTIVI